ncbi:hypothetical protein KC221_26490, partial [Mycobacterium tuberculosis]|nr:hypothetical protein [Mycobacterium tuberculosis]
MVAGENRIGTQIETAAIASYARDLNGALIEDCVVGLMGLGRAACSTDRNIDRREDGYVQVDHATDEIA